MTMTLTRKPTPNPDEPFATAAQTYAQHHVKDYLAHDPELPPDVAASLVRIAARLDHKDHAFQVEAADAAEAEVRLLGGAS